MQQPKFDPGFDPVEAKALMGVIVQLEGSSPPLPDPPMPEDWTLEFDSDFISVFRNRWQLWKDAGGRTVVVIRGTDESAGGVAEDVLAVPISAKLGSMPLFSDDEKSAVHLGFALGALLLLLDPKKGILTKLKDLRANTDVIIAGHSQGAAVSTLVRSFLHYLPKTSDLLPKLNYKTYIFAQPKPGNDRYGRDLERIACNSGMFFNTYNNLDWVAQVPFTLEWLSDLNEPNPLDLLSDKIKKRSIKEPVPEDHFKKSEHTSIIQEALNALKEFKKITEDFLELLRVIGLVIEAFESIKVMGTLNYVNCGAPISLKGTPGTNPDDPTDFMWQHHGSMYYKLLCETFP